MTFKEHVTALFVAGWAFFSPVHSLMTMTGALVILDLFTGIWKALKLEEKITSFRLRQTVTKGLGYMTAIVVAFILDRLTESDTMVSRTVAGLIALVEAKSCSENLHVITGLNLWSAILAKIQPSKDQPPSPPSPPASPEA